MIIDGENKIEEDEDGGATIVVSDEDAAASLARVPDTVRATLDAMKIEDDDPPAGGGDPADDLRRQMEAKDREIAELRRQADKNGARAASAEVSAADSQFYALENAIASLEQTKTGLKDQMKAALEQGDYNLHTDLNEKLNEVQLDLRMRNSQKAQVEQRKTRTAEGRVTAEPTVADHAEQFASRLASEDSKKWIRRHPQYAVPDSDDNKNLVKAHYVAVDQGMSEGSPEYYAFVEKKLGIGNSDTRPAPRQQSRAAPAAPVSRDAPSASGRPTGGGTRVSLSADEMKAARISGLTPQQYAANKLALTAEGKMGKPN